MFYRDLLTVFLAVALLLGIKLPAEAITLDLNPVRVFFANGTKAEKLAIRNGGDRRISLQLRVYTWSQDAEGMDKYQETSDLLVFPKLLKLEKDEERIVRIGLRSGEATDERTYRLYLDEIPETKAPDEGATIRIVTKTGVPVFVAPAKRQVKGTIGAFSVQKGAAHITVKNEGNVHFFIKSVTLTGRNGDGASLFSQQLNGWYLLKGASRQYTAAIPGEVCPKIAKIAAEVVVEGQALNGSVTMDKAMCQP